MDYCVASDCCRCQRVTMRPGKAYGMPWRVPQHLYAINNLYTQDIIDTDVRKIEGVLKSSFRHRSIRELSRLTWRDNQITEQLDATKKYLAIKKITVGLGVDYEPEITWSTTTMMLLVMTSVINFQRSTLVVRTIVKTTFVHVFKEWCHEKNKVECDTFRGNILVYFFVLNRNTRNRSKYRLDSRSTFICLLQLLLEGNKKYCQRKAATNKFLFFFLVWFLNFRKLVTFLEMSNIFRYDFVTSPHFAAPRNNLSHFQLIRFNPSSNYILDRKRSLRRPLHITLQSSYTF